MTRKKGNAKKLNLKEILAEDEDFLRVLIQQTVQHVLEAEMDEAVGRRRANGQRSGRGTDPGITAGRW